MNTVSKLHIAALIRLLRALNLLGLGLALCTLSSRAHADETPKASTVLVKLSEWKVTLTPSVVPPGPVVFEVTNSGKVPHALEI